MNKKEYKISDLSPHLFWDVDENMLSWDKNQYFLVERILEYGKEKDWQILKIKYGIKLIAKIATKLRTLDKVTLHFIATISNTPLTDFRCYTTTQSARNYFGF